MRVTNPAILTHTFLQEMLDDPYFPRFLVEKGQQILLRLCAKLELARLDDETVIELCNEATEEFNVLGAEFDDNGSQIETAARDSIGAAFAFILETYGLKIDTEQAMSSREW